MTFTIEFASHRTATPEYVDIETIDDLRELYDRYGRNAVIVDFEDMTITIYDDYME